MTGAKLRLLSVRFVQEEDRVLLADCDLVLADPHLSFAALQPRQITVQLGELLVYLKLILKVLQKVILMTPLDPWQGALLTCVDEK